MVILIPEFNYSAGTETVILKVLPRWVKAGHKVILAAPASRLRHYESRGLQGGVRCVELDGPTRGWRRWAGALSRRLKFNWGTERLRLAALRRQARRERATHVFIPWVVDQPVMDFGLPMGIMVMDLAWRHYPEGWFGKPTQLLDARMADWLRAADGVFPVSDATAAELEAAFPAQADKLVAVPHGADGNKLGAADPVPASVPPFFLTPASLTPNKNHRVLLEAAIELWREGLDFVLVWTGPATRQVIAEKPAIDPGVRALQALYQANRDMIAGRLHARGFVGDAELDKLYGEALRVVLPSSYEGFGLPVLEAFERGARVICTEIAAFREQIRRYQMEDRAAAVMLGDKMTLVDAMRQALANGHETGFDSDTMKRRLTAWTWDDAARRYLEVLMPMVR